MFDIGWSEMAVILLVALIVIGPRDLPRVARTMGRWAAKGRAMAREFQTALEDMAREAELDKVKSEIEKAGRGIESVSRTNVGKTIEKSIDPTGELSKAFEPTTGGVKADAAKPGEGAAQGSPAKASQPEASEAATSAAAAPAKATAETSKTKAPSTAGSLPKSSSPKSSPSKSSPSKSSPANSAKAAPAEPSAPQPPGHGDRPRAPASRRVKAAAAPEPRESAREPAPAEPS